MFFKQRAIKIILSTILVVVSRPGFLSASWWEMKRIPVPAHTHQVKEEHKKSKGVEFDLISYESTADTQTISDFYRKKFTQLGWEERNPFAAMSRILGGAVPGGMEQLSSGNLIFRKGMDLIVIRFTLEGPKTGYLLGKIKILPEAIKPLPDTFSPEKLNAQLKHEVAPVYPDAYLINLSEKTDSFIAAYFSRDNLKAITSFYKSQMSSYGWVLDKETPFKKIDYPFALPKGILNNKECPTCPEKEKSFLPRQVGAFTELTFSNSHKDSYKIYLFTPESLKHTIITVAYEKKK